MECVQVGGSRPRRLPSTVITIPESEWWVVTVEAAAFPSLVSIFPGE